MAHEEEEDAQAPVPRVAASPSEELTPVFGSTAPAEAESGLTVLVAFAANALVAVAKTVAAVITGSASLVAEAARSWTDSGNEIFLMVANRRSRRPPDDAHPFGHGREACRWPALC